jgi:hypothetical protein
MLSVIELKPTILNMKSINYYKRLSMTDEDDSNQRNQISGLMSFM